MKIPIKNIPTYDANKKEWSTTSFETQKIRFAGYSVSRRDNFSNFSILVFLTYTTKVNKRLQLIEIILLKGIVFNSGYDVIIPVLLNSVNPRGFVKVIKIFV